MSTAFPQRKANVADLATAQAGLFWPPSMLSMSGDPHSLL